MNARALAESFVSAVLARRWLATAAVALALFAAWGAYGNAVDWDLTKLPADNRIEVWFLDDDPAMVRYHQFQETFGNDEAILVSFSAEPTVFTPATLDLIDDISTRLQLLPRIRGVTSLATVLHTGDEDGWVQIERMYRAPVDPEDARDIRRRVLDNPLYRDLLVSPDERTALLTIQLESVDLDVDAPADAPAPEPTPAADLDLDAWDDILDTPAPTPDPDATITDIDAERGAILDEVRAEIDAAFAAAEREPDWHWGGIGVINEALNDLSREDVTKFYPLTFLVILACLWFSLRRVITVTLALLTVYLASTLLLGLYLATGHSLNLVTMVLPTLVLVIGLTDSIYFITIYYQERASYEAQGLTKRQAIVKSVGFCFLPGLFNSITASVGFLAFLTANMPVLRVFGVFAGIGILLAFLMSVLVCAIGFDLFDIRPPGTPTTPDTPATPTEPPPPSVLQRFLAWLAQFVVARHRAIVAVSAVVFLAAAAGIALIRVDTYTIAYFYDDHPVRQDDRAMQQAFGPYLPMEVVVDTKEQGGIKDPEVLQGIDRLQTNVVGSDERVGSATSLTGIVKRLNEVFAGGPTSYRIPDRRDVIEQEMLFYDPERRDDPLVLTDLPRYQHGRITFRTANDSAQAAADLIRTIEAEAEAELPPEVDATPSGYVPLYVRLIDYLVLGQVTSLATTFLVVFAIIAVLFRSLRYALISIPPNVIPVAATLGFMGYAGINLDVATVLIASIALGVAVDDTIHFIFKFRDVYERTGDDVRAVQETLRSTGLAIASTSLVISLGFSVLCFASVKSIALFGILTAVTMLSALLGELFVTPAIILTFSPRRPRPHIGQGL